MLYNSSTNDERDHDTDVSREIHGLPTALTMTSDNIHIRSAWLALTLHLRTS